MVLNIMFQDFLILSYVLLRKKSFQTFNFENKTIQSIPKALF